MNPFAGEERPGRNGGLNFLDVEDGVDRGIAGIVFIFRVRILVEYENVRESYGAGRLDVYGRERNIALELFRNAVKERSGEMPLHAGGLYRHCCCH